MKLSERKIKQFQEKILTWYKSNQRSLPWRGVPDGTPLQERAYKVFISEVMSQQTQITRVVPKFEAWMQKFPTVESLATAKVAEVLYYWSGLGYNRRALNLKKTAEIIVKNFNGKFPNTEKELLELPGIGKYTAQAILCFAFDQQVAVVDTNVRKIILTQFRHSGEEQRDDSRIRFSLRDSGRAPSSFARMTEKKLEEIAEQLLPDGRAYDWNQALMDYAAAVLKKEKIPIARQSKFHGSHRYYRGQVLKNLLKHKTILVKDLGSLIKKDYTESEKIWLNKLVQELIDEGFIVKEQGMVALAS